jgi:hypothetical protein
VISAGHGILALWVHFGNKMGTGLATSAQCGYNVRALGEYRNCRAIKAFKYHRNVFSNTNDMAEVPDSRSGP